MVAKAYIDRKQGKGLYENTIRYVDQLEMEFKRIKKGRGIYHKRCSEDIDKFQQYPEKEGFQIIVF